jgi:drug/metabolite transporter (DMT)-like permease
VSNACPGRRRISISYKGLAAIVIVVIFWGFSFLSTKKTLELYPPEILGLIRNGLAALFLLPAFLWDRKRNKSKPTPSLLDLVLLAAAGLAGVTFYFVFENNGIALVSVSEAAIVVGAIPILVLIVEWVYARFCRNRRKPAASGGETAAGETAASGGMAADEASLRQWVGAFISIGGVALVSSAGIVISGSAKGYLYMAGAAVGWAAYCFLTRGLFNRRSYIEIVFYQTLFGFIGFFPFAASQIPHLVPPTPAAAAHLIFLALGCSAICYVLYVYALKALGAAASSIFINLIPVITVVAGFFLLDDRLSPTQWAGAALAIIGVYLGQR